MKKNKSKQIKTINENKNPCFFLMIYKYLLQNEEKKK